MTETAAERILDGILEKKSERRQVMENPSEYVVGWGTLALINAGIDQAKDRSGLAWFLGSLFLGSLATLLIVVLDPRPGEAD